MSLTGLLRERLAESLAERLRQGESGFCLRVDYLGPDDAEGICRSLRNLISDDGNEVYVLSTSQGSSWDISPERAIEIRNRKQVRLCLFIPVGVMDAAASSLTNSFASFELTDFWNETANILLNELPAEIQPSVRRVLTTLRGSLAATQEQRADYLAAVRAIPNLRTVGLEMWRIGLIPDAGEIDFVERLEKNQMCVRELSRPSRANSSSDERLEALRLSDAKCGRRLREFFAGKRLRDSRSWLEELASSPSSGELTFEKWEFEEGEQSDLERIDVEPLLNEDGVVETYTKLRQSEVGAQPAAAVGSTGKVCVKWASAPKSPANLNRWKAELIPSRDYYAENEMPTVDLPAAKASGRTRRVTIPLDIELAEEEPSIAVQVRIVGIDASGAELLNSEGKVQGAATC